MKAFMCDDFLLESPTAIKLYQEFARDLPIIDYHCHISPREIYENKSFDSITQVWLGGDHYKWRAMRTYGIAESGITGSDSDKEKFINWAKTLPMTLGNPLFHWSHLELRAYFGIDEVLSEDSAEDIWKVCQSLIGTEGFRPRQLIERSGVEALSTTDDPVDTLEWHKRIKSDPSFDVIVTPSFRPDKGINIEADSFLPWLQALEESVGSKIRTLKDYLDAFDQRIDHFHRHDCRIADHALDQVVYAPFTKESAALTFDKRLAGLPLTEDESHGFKTCMLIHCGKAYAEKNWVMQYHIGALRNNSSRMYKKLGPDTGFDSIQDGVFAVALSNLLDQLDASDQLPKTILYGLNPRDNYLLATMIGNFQGGGIKGKVQFGSAWWFCDQKEGMIKQIKDLSSLGLLSCFVGMLTDSRSFLSYPRHEYFRRILCNEIGKLVENGEYPNDEKFLRKIVEDVCYYNAKKYFSYDL